MAFALCQKKIDAAQEVINKASQELEALDLTWSIYQQTFGSQSQPPRATELHSTVNKIPTPETDERETSEPEREDQKPETRQEDFWKHEEAPGQNGTPKPFKLAKEVKVATGEFQDQTFTQKDVSERIRQKSPEAKVYAGSVSGRLAKLVEDREIEIVKKSSGGADPTLYREVRLSPN